MEHSNKTGWREEMKYEAKKRKKKKLRIEVRTQIWKQNRGISQVNLAPR